MRLARSPAPSALDEVTFDALAADLTVPHQRPLVDLDRDDYAILEVDSATAPFTKPYERVDVATEPIVKARPRPPRRRWWSTQRIVAAVLTLPIGFGLGAGIALLLS